MTDRQRWNWHAAINLQNELRRFIQMNTQSLCDGVCFLGPDERAFFLHTMYQVQKIAHQIETDQRSVKPVSFEGVVIPPVDMGPSLENLIDPSGPL
jgi:hypothetical protein